MERQPDPPAAQLDHRRDGAGPPVLLVHGLGGTMTSWGAVGEGLATTHEVIRIDLPGHGRSPVLPGSGTFAGLADAVAGFIVANGLIGIAAAGHSLGGRVVLEMARRGLVGPTVALGPGGFWNAAERRFVKASLLGSVRLVRRARGMLPLLTRHRAGRMALLAQISARPGRVPPEAALHELRAFATTPVFDALVRDLAEGPGQEGTADTPGPVTLVWGRQDRLLFPRQAREAARVFPKARLHWIEACGHYPQWDAPGESLRLIRQAVGRPGLPPG